MSFGADQVSAVLAPIPQHRRLLMLVRRDLLVAVRQARSPLLVTAAVSMAGFFVARANNVPADHLTRDVVSVSRAAAYVGVFSTIGVMLWVASGVLALATASAAATADRADVKRNGRFLWCFGLGCLSLGFDDVFVVHDRLLPRYLGIPEKLIFAVYFLAVVGLFWRFRAALVSQAHRALLYLAVGLLAASIAVDAAPHEFLGVPLRTVEYFEDTLKLMGLSVLLTYSVSTCRSLWEGLRCIHGDLPARDASARDGRAAGT